MIGQKAMFRTNLLLMAACLSTALTAAAENEHEHFLRSVSAKCMQSEPPGKEVSKGVLRLGGGHSIGYVNLQQGNGDLIRMYERDIRSGARLYELYTKTEKGVRASVSAKFDNNCLALEGREIEYDTFGKAERIHWLGKGLNRTGYREDLNPPVPDSASHFGVKVALVDSGVNYLLPEIARALARDAQGNILGYDFREMDDRPYDVDPIKRGPFDPLRHGTSVASVLLENGKETISLVPYSFPGVDPRRFQLLIQDLQSKGIKIANMSIGSSDPRAKEPWTIISRAIETAPEILFVIAAGNEGKNIDATPHYPASFRLPNVLIVGAVNETGKVSTKSNYGTNVDVAAKADPVLGRDFMWNSKMLHGTSFAAPKISALAAKILQAEPKLTATQLKSRICSLAKPLPEKNKIACGYFD
ncbi:S8 family peptidase [Azotobacter chroococcum]|uniref:S8 family peptidase n=1 Tax=Azotobacter chroococcum TaxID=353 RepID=UPI000B793D89|nr:S8 family serine peptidase [Azotobacter chroococcum]